MTETLDCRGMRCPQPILKTAMKFQSLPKGTTLTVLADCSEFPTQIKEWCDKTGRVLINIVEQDGTMTATLRT